MKNKLLFIFIAIFISIDNTYTLENDYITFSKNEVEIINLIFNEFINYHTDTELLILRQEINWSSYLQKGRLNIIRNKIHDDELIDNFIYRNTNENGIIDPSNVFNVENIIFMIEDEFDTLYRSQLNIEKEFTTDWFTRSFDNNLTWNEVMEQYENVRIKRTYIIISWIGFNETRDKAFVSFEYIKNHLIPTRGLVYLFFLKENGVWNVIDINGMY